MSGTFSSFGSALSALRYNRVALDVASGNIANAHTEGYTRRMATAQATGAPAVQALWSKWNGYAGGVEVGGIERMVDPLLDVRSRSEHASLSHLDTRAASLVRFETTIGEPSANGISAALSAFKQGWHDVANNPGDEAARSQLLGRAGVLEAAIKSQATAVETEYSDQRARMVSVVEEVNTLAQDLANLNGAVQAATVSGNDASTLLDQRDQLALRLSQLTGAKTSDGGDGRFNITVNGQPLVTGSTAGSVALSGGLNVADASSLTVSITTSTTPSTTAQLAPSGTKLLGELGGSFEVLVTDLPDYKTRLDGFVSTLVTEVNAEHSAAYNLHPAPVPPATTPAQTGINFFSGSSASDIAVAITDPRDVAAADSAGTLDGSVASKLATLDLGGSAYRSLVTDFGVKVASARRVAENQGVLTGQVDASRESLAGVNIDEEMVNLLAAQRAYEGASRVISTLDSVLDTLINRTGLTR